MSHSPQAHKLLRKAGIVIFWLAAWHLLALAVDNEILLVTPVQAFLRLWESLWQGGFWKTVFCSFLRIAAGFGTGTAGALLLAVASSRFRVIEELLRPLISLLKAVPVVSFVVLLLIWQGSSLLAVWVSLLIVLPGVYLGTLEGLKSVDRKLLEMAEVFRLSSGARFFYIYCPSLRPFLTSSLQLALGLCWKSGVAAEVIGTPDFSIGERLYLSKIYLDTGGVFAWTAVILLLSFGFERAVLWMMRKFFAWEPQVKGQRVHPGKSAVSMPGGQAEGTQPEEAPAGEPQAGCQGSGGFVCSHIEKRYGGLTVFHDFNQAYGPGEIYFLSSPSGSGKTTLLRLLAGLEKPDGGEVHRCRAAAMVFQEDRLCEGYSAVRNVALVTGDDGNAREALKRLLPPGALDKPCRELSGGMKRRVALVRAMEASSDAVLLDEPFTGLDAESRAAAEEYIRDRQRGRTLIVATHIGSGLQA